MNAAVIRGLVVGDLFDFGRIPSLTYLAAVGFGICLLRWRNERYLIPVAIFTLWLMLYFGRATWGNLMDVLPLSREIHMNRFVGGVIWEAYSLSPSRWPPLYAGLSLNPASGMSRRLWG